MPNGFNWICEKCGRDLNPVGDCLPCHRQWRNAEEASGRRKRGKNLKVGDVIKRTMCNDRTVIETLETTGKGKVHVNKGHGDRTELVFWDVQWVDMEVPA